MTSQHIEGLCACIENTETNWKQIAIILIVVVCVVFPGMLFMILRHKHAAAASKTIEITQTADGVANNNEST